MDVRIHPARHDQQPGGVDRARAGSRGQPGPDLHYGPVPQPHVGGEPPLRGDHGAAADEDLLGDQVGCEHSHRQQAGRQERGEEDGEIGLVDNPIPCTWFNCEKVWRFEIEEHAMNYEGEVLWVTLWRVIPGVCVDLCYDDL